eukprot:TRINITY_DN81296_c0_g1_i1.p2 TRINITY_DN81296_c0_g1~~TRINITY_DN81296_c0_g1_i1.p2  ORF type:complete len:230 (+),score=21.70 TRINITY_DN81296_c0_g1_i1:235-924(+)
MAACVRLVDGDEVTFRCARCIRVISTEDPMFMRHDAPFCSDACRSKGRSKLHAELAETQLQRFEDWRASDSRSVSTLTDNNSQRCSSVVSSNRRGGTSEGSGASEGQGSAPRRTGLGGRVQGFFGNIFTQAFKRIASGIFAAGSDHGSSPRSSPRSLNFGIPHNFAGMDSDDRSPSQVFAPSAPGYFGGFSARGSEASSGEMLPDGTVWRHSQAGSVAGSSSGYSGYRG